jgi:hypothetical protein
MMRGEDPEATNQEETQPEGSTARKGLAAWLMEISRETSAMMNDGRTSKELMDELYDDETGLPK